MTQKQFASSLVEYDREATEAAYAALPLGVGCACYTCCNFEKATSDFPNEVRMFFEALGVDLTKPGEVYDFTVENERVWYGGWYNIVGNYLAYDDTWRPTAESPSQQEKYGFFKIAENFYIAFSDGAELVPASFSSPVLQMGIDFTLPWVLEESYEDLIEKL
ncbi:MAG: hypothetical protein FWD99_02695 [Oscillospiraceae bacterium]|nr:hypothetical protein [Oscillospiraceae bacterium]